MSKSIKKAPSTSGTDKPVGGERREQNTQEKKQMHQFNKALFGVIYLILKVSFLLAGITLMKMAPVHFIVDIPLYQIVGGIILVFVIYLELYEYFVNRNSNAKGKKQRQAPANAVSALTDGLDYIETPVK